MRSHIRIAVAFALAVSAAPTLALERTPARLPSDPADSWSSAWTCTIRYYNTCTDWIWLWGGWSGFDRVGVANSPACSYYPLSRTQILIGTGAPAGYGYTGHVAVHFADANGCPVGPALSSQPWLPTGSRSYQVHDWNLSVPPYWVVLYTFGPVSNSPATIATDHPVAGPTGPAACGSCYPTTRTNHSYYYGSEGAPMCPGSPFFDGACDAQLIVDQIMIGFSAIEPTTWGSVKSLYR